VHVRVCRECGEEYRPEIAVCADCGADLVDTDDDAPAIASPALPGARAGEGGEPASILYYSPTSARDLTPLADELLRAGLPFQIQTESGLRRQTHYRLVVPERTADEARRVLAPVAERHPELDLHLVAPPLSEEEEEAERARASCPACGDHVPPGVHECPGCGLSLYVEDDDGD
jgi:hypothetical protein